MDEKKDWRWEFLGFESEFLGRPVQKWFDNLPDEAKEEICDLLLWLRTRIRNEWRLPYFDPLKGEKGISEIRPRDIVQEKMGEIEKLTYRIYGFFGPVEHCYTFLHGNQKLERNDKNAKRIARERLSQIERRDAFVHRFEFSE